MKKLHDTTYGFSSSIHIYAQSFALSHTKKKKNVGTLGATEQYTTKTCVGYNRKLQRTNTRCRINIKKNTVKA